MTCFKKSPNPKYLILISVLFCLVAISCTTLTPDGATDTVSMGVGKSNKPEGTVYSTLLSMVPDSFGTRSSVYINDYALARQQYAMPLPEQINNNDELTEFGLALTDEAGANFGPWLSGLHQYMVPFFENQAHLGYDISKIDQTIVAGRPPQPIEIVKGRFDAKQINFDTKVCQECPLPTREAHQGIGFYSWGEDGELSLRLRMRPPAFDHLGRSSRIAIQDDYLIRTLETSSMKAVIDSTRGQRQSLYDVEEFRILSKNFSEMGVYSAYLTVDVAGYHEIMRNDLANVTGHPSKLDFQQAKLLPYEAMGVGIGKDSAGRFIGVVLIHSDPDLASGNGGRLSHRLENLWIQRYSRPWHDFVDVFDTEFTVEERTLVAKIRLNEEAQSRLWLYIAIGEPLLWHE